MSAIVVSMVKIGIVIFALTLFSPKSLRADEEFVNLKLGGTKWNLNHESLTKLGQQYQPGKGLYRNELLFDQEVGSNRQYIKIEEYKVANSRVFDLICKKLLKNHNALAFIKGNSRYNVHKTSLHFKCSESEEKIEISIELDKKKIVFDSMLYIKEYERSQVFRIALHDDNVLLVLDSFKGTVVDNLYYHFFVGQLRIDSLVSYFHDVHMDHKLFPVKRSELLFVLPSEL